MQIVIDIPESRYEECLAWRKKGKFNVHPLELAVANGISLPKGHGDLIDRNTIQMSAEKFHSLGDLYTAQWVVDTTPTVIPADKGEKE